MGKKVFQHFQEEIMKTITIKGPDRFIDSIRDFMWSLQESLKHYELGDSSDIEVEEGQ